MEEWTWGIGVAVCLSLILLAVWAWLLARRALIGFDTTSEQRVKAIRASALEQKQVILEEALRVSTGKYEVERRSSEDDRALSMRTFQDMEQQLNLRQSEIDKKAAKIQQIESQIQTQESAVQEIQAKTKQNWIHASEFKADRKQLVENKADQNRDHLQESISEELLNTERLGISKWVLENGEALKADSQRMARQVLESVYLRYTPHFVWPKTNFVVPVPNPHILDRHFSDGSPLVSLLLEGTQTTLEVMREPAEDAPAHLKLSGGAGVDKEMLRMTLEEMIGRNVWQEDRVRAIVQKQKKYLDRFTHKLGEEAAKVLELKNLHPEILKLIGSLNYRTSHRQNQYFHSLEVSRLAGMLADELGVDRVLAKRSGLLHDIGKALDYKIEGSHAVISGDYATRFGENEEVVDTILSHHDDKIVETPFAYLLKAADAMSGARPGARVDMEEGYQKRIESIYEVVTSFQPRGVQSTAIMHAGREVHVFIDNQKVKDKDMEGLASDIARKLESDVQFPGQIRVTLVRRVEVSEVA